MLYPEGIAYKAQTKKVQLTGRGKYKSYVQEMLLYRPWNIVLSNKVFANEQGQDVHKALRCGEQCLQARLLVTVWMGRLGHPLKRGSVGILMSQALFSCDRSEAPSVSSSITSPHSCHLLSNGGCWTLEGSNFFNQEKSPLLLLLFRRSFELLPFPAL